MRQRRSRHKQQKNEKEVQNADKDYYTVEKILDMKQQRGKTYYLVKWLNWDVKTCTWEDEANVQHLKGLIKEYHNSRKYDRQNNMGLKQFDQVQPGMSPYEATRFYGHFLYGDEPASIESVQMIEKNGRKEMHLLVQWIPRESGFKPTNSLIESKVIEEHAPMFLINFFQNHSRMIVQQ